jgi:hypothetical protein
LGVEDGVGGKKSLLRGKLLTAEVALFERSLSKLLLKGDLSAQGGDFLGVIVGCGEVVVVFEIFD